jgi:signal transduction histidine kinase
MQSISSNIENLISAENGEFEMDKKERLSALSIALSELHILGMHAENMQRTLVGDESQQLVFRGCSIRSILRDCIGALTPAARLKNVDFSQIKLKSMKEFPKTEVFRPDLTRAFKNLYHNAVKYSYSGLGLSSSSTYQKRWISTEIGPIDNGSFYVEIQNYGVGIAPDEIEGIFEPGTRGRYSIDRHRTGSGIGLSQVRRIVLRHNGAVSITSEKRGGPWVTTVRVILPYQQPKEAIRYDDNVEDALG